MDKLVIIGAGDFAREVAWLVERINDTRPTWELLGYLDDTTERVGTMLAGYPILGDDRWLDSNGAGVYAVCAVGSSQSRKKAAERHRHIQFATLIDPSVILSDRIILGIGCIICAGSILTVDITVGDHVIINLNCTVGHDAVLKDFVTLSPGVNISGKTVIGQCAELGTGSQMIPGKIVGDCSIVGAGAVIVRDLPANCLAVGCPARPVKQFDK